jgi:hypothetical protein
MELGDGGAVENLDFGFQLGQAFKISGTVTDSRVLFDSRCRGERDS